MTTEISRNENSSINILLNDSSHINLDTNTTNEIPGSKIESAEDKNYKLINLILSKVYAFSHIALSIIIILRLIDIFMLDNGFDFFILFFPSLLLVFMGSMILYYIFDIILRLINDHKKTSVLVQVLNIIIKISILTYLVYNGNVIQKILSFIIERPIYNKAESE